MSTTSRTRQSLRTAIRAASRPGPLRQALCGLEGCPVGGWPETAQARGRVTDELCHRSERSFTTADLIEAVMHEDSAGRWRWKADGGQRSLAKTPEIAWPLADARPIPVMYPADLRVFMLRLADAFGGFSQIPDEAVGQALAGRIINNGGGAPSAATLAEWHSDRWGDGEAWEQGDDEEFALRVIAAANKRLAEATGV